LKSKKNNVPSEYMFQHGVGKKDGLCMNMEMPELFDK